MAWRFPFPEWFLIALLPHDAVLCGYCEENGSLPFCVWVTVEDIVPSYCWTTCRCFQFWEPDQQWFFVYTPPACRGNMRSHRSYIPFCRPTWSPICNFDQYYLYVFLKIIKLLISWKYFFVTNPMLNMTNPNSSFKISGQSWRGLLIFLWM